MRPALDRLKPLYEGSEGEGMEGGREDPAQRLRTRGSGVKRGGPRLNKKFQTQGEEGGKTPERRIAELVCTQEIDLRPLVDFSEEFRAVIFFGDYKRVFLELRREPPLLQIGLPLASLLPLSKASVGKPAGDAQAVLFGEEGGVRKPKRMGLSLPFPVPLFDLGKPWPSISDRLAQCSQLFRGTVIELEVKPANKKDLELVARFAERDWPGPLFTNAWKKAFDPLIPLAQEKAKFELYSVEAKLRGDEGLLNCAFSGMTNKLVLGGKKVILSSPELAFLLQPTPRPAGFVTSTSLIPAEPPSALRQAKTKKPNNNKSNVKSLEVAKRRLGKKSKGGKAGSAQQPRKRFPSKPERPKRVDRMPLTRWSVKGGVRRTTTRRNSNSISSHRGPAPPCPAPLR